MNNVKELENKIKQLELELSNMKSQENDQRFRNLVEHALYPILILKGEDMTLDLANEPLFKLWNVSKEALGKPFLEILPEMKDQPFMGLLLDVLHNRTTHYGNEQPAHFVRSNGEKETVYFNFVYQPYHENDGTVSGVIVFANDVTVQVKQKMELEECAFELKEKNKELVFENGEKEKRAAELIVANKELAFQNEEKEKRAAELFTARTELIFQNTEKENRAAELVIANIELAFQNNEKEKRADELGIANKELAFQNEEKEKRAEELIIANNELMAFTYVSSHDLQEPLRKIQTFVTMILKNENKNLSEGGKYHFERVQLAAGKMQQLITDLLSFSRVSTAELKFEKQTLIKLLKK